MCGKAILLTVLLCSCCTYFPPPASNVPFLSDPPLPNGCLLWALKAEAQLPANIWKRVLVVRYSQKGTDGIFQGHAYCIFAIGERTWAYDTRVGSKNIFPSNKSVAEVMKVTDEDAVEGYYVEDKIAVK